MYTFLTNLLKKYILDSLYAAFLKNLWKEIKEKVKKWKI